MNTYQLMKLYDIEETTRVLNVYHYWQDDLTKVQIATTAIDTFCMFQRDSLDSDLVY